MLFLIAVKFQAFLFTVIPVLLSRMLVKVVMF